MLFILDRNEKIIGTLRHDLKVEDPSVSGGVFFDDLLTEDLATGSDIFEFTTYNTLKASQNLVIGNYIVFSFKGRYKLFQIIQIETSHDESLEMKIYCEGAGLELINKVIRKQKLVSCTLDRFLKTILADTGWEVGTTFLSEVSTDIEFESESVYSILQNNIGLFGGELDFRVEIKKNKIVAKYVDVYYEKGTVTGKRFEYGRNSDSIIRNVDSSELFTALIGVGNNDINFSDVAIQGIEKPIGQDFVADQQAFERYNHNGYHLMGVFQYNTDSKEELLRETYKKLQECKEPKIQYEVSVCALEEEIGNINIGDTVTVVDNFFNPPLWLMARVSKLETSRSNPQNSSCTLANFVEVSSNITDEMRKLASKLEGYVEGSISSKFPITGDNIADGSIGGNHVIRDSITTQHLKADSIEANHIKADQIEANHIKAESIQTSHLTADIIESDHIKANQIEAKHIAANAISSDMIQTGSVTSDKMVISEGFIKDAMISNINASKINAGTLNTNNILIGNDKILIADSTQQFRDNQGNVRLQLGEDAKGDFNFILKGKNGSTVLIDSEGIKEGAISDGLIKENMVGDGEIGGKKIDINSFSEEFNKETNTSSLKASKVRLDTSNQTLEVGFNQLKTQTQENVNITQALQTNLQVEQGKINSLISNTTITKDGQTTQLKDEYNKTVQKVNSIQSDIVSLNTTVNEATKKVTSIDEKSNQIKRDLDETVSTISSHTQEIDELNSNVSNAQSSIQQLNNSISLKAERSDIETAISNLDISGLRTQIGDTKNSLVELETTMNSTFKDGILDESEKAILRQKLIDLDIEYSKLDAQLLVLLNNVDLQQSQQLTKLNSVKTANTKAYNELVSYIKNIITGHNGTSNLNKLFSTYATTFKNVEVEIQNSIEFIAEKKKTDSESFTNKAVANLKVDVDKVTTSVESVKTSMETVNGEVASIDKRVSSAEQKIQPEAITSTVLSNQKFKDATNSLRTNLIAGGNFLNREYHAWEESRRYNISFYEAPNGETGIYSTDGTKEGWICSNKIYTKSFSLKKVSLAMSFWVESNCAGCDVYLQTFGSNQQLLNEELLFNVGNGFSGIKKVENIDISASEVFYISIRIDNNGKITAKDEYYVVFINYINLINSETCSTEVLQDNGAFESLRIQTDKKIEDKISQKKGEEIAQSVVTQSLNSFRVELSSSGGNNLLRNSQFQKDTTFWSFLIYQPDGIVNNPKCFITDGALSEWILDGKKALTLNCASIDGQANFRSEQSFSTITGRQYSFRCLIAGHRSNKVVVIRGDNWTWLASKRCNYQIYGGKNLSDWEEINLTFIANSSKTSVVFEVSSDGNADPYMWIIEPCVVEGPINSGWCGNANEVYTSIAEINENGLTVSHSNGSSASFNHDGSVWRDKVGKEILRINGQGLEYISPDSGVWTSFVKSSQRSSNAQNKGVSFSTSGNGNYVSLGCSKASNPKDNWETSSGISVENYYFNQWWPGIHVWAMDTASKDKTFFHNHTDYIQEGGNIHMNNQMICFDAYGSSYPNWIGRTNTGRLAVFGDNEVVLGTRHGSTNRSAILITEGDTYDTINSWCKWNFNNYSITGASILYRMANPVTRSFTEDTILKSYTPSTRYVYKDVESKNGKAILSIPNVYKGCDYTVCSIVKKGRGDAWVSQEKSTHFIIETENDITLNVEIDIISNEVMLTERSDDSQYVTSDATDEVHYHDSI